MKAGEQFKVDHITMLMPLVGQLVDMEGPDGEKFKARIIGINNAVNLKVVPASTKE